jgi:ACR3 family arsenite efflux pump ArsB
MMTLSLIPRLLFLLQCCVTLSDGALGQRSTTLPLTLGSTVKKFSKRMLQTSNAVKNFQKQVIIFMELCLMYPEFLLIFRVNGYFVHSEALIDLINVPPTSIFCRNIN